MLVLSRKPSEQIQIGENITVTVVHVKGKVVKLGIDAPRNIRILRTELTMRDEAGGDREDAGAHVTASAEDEPAGEDDAGGIHACHGRARRNCDHARPRRGITMNRRTPSGIGSVVVD